MTYYVYDVDSALHVLVDLRNRRVIRATSAPGAEAPIAQQETATARALAVADEAVRAALRRFDQPVESLRMDHYAARDASAPDGCATRRCVQLLFVGRRGSLADPEIFVDLTRRRTVVRPNRRVR